ncbi:MAG TPA: NADH-quinone oxidoreductase subunit D [Candidatus Polarisedimenticolia bacterium]|jgi:NADH-quinone oxidoreductase subunit D|nr:NADH-quinone oxidoreductase subunit D [Candidatus Polarisedimenticolia bacterium]
MFRTEEMDINMGPQHPSTHGVLRLKLTLDGEEVADMRPVIGYLHRGVEKLCEHRTYPMIEPLTDRLDYVAAISENLGYCGAVEKLMGLTVPPRAQYIRVILAELQRIASHLLWLGTHALDLGAMTVFFYTFREREMILDLFEAFCGARLTYNSMRIGGLYEDLPAGWTGRVRQFIDIFPSREKEYEDLLTVNRIWLGRTRGVGILKPEDAVALGASGPTLRGSGVDYDVRRAQPYSSYDQFEFDVPVGRNGDTYDRYIVRMEEMRQSCRIIRQALDKLPEGEVRAKVPKYIKPPTGEVYHVVESPRGEQGFYIVHKSGEMPYRMRFRAPSFVNLQALPLMCKGLLIADIVAVIGSIDIVLGDVDR